MISTIRLVEAKSSSNIFFLHGQRDIAPGQVVNVFILNKASTKINHIIKRRVKTQIENAGLKNKDMESLVREKWQPGNKQY